jgi:hypothetical protein
VQLPKDIDQIVIAAISYNAATAQIVKNLFAEEISIPIHIHSGYGLPLRITPKTLVIAISICGKRPEVLSAVKMAYAANARVVAITTGKELEAFARERNLPLILIDKTLPEMNQLTGGKMSAGIIIAILTQILINTGVLNPKARQRVLAAVTEIETMYLPKLGGKIAEMIAETNLLIYSSETYLGLASLAKALLNILEQMPCFVNTITEALNSEIYSFQRKGSAKYCALILQDAAESTTTQSSIQKLQEKLTATKLKSYILELPGSNQLTKTLAGIMLLYWVSYSLISQQK